MSHYNYKGIPGAKFESGNSYRFGDSSYKISLRRLDKSSNWVTNSLSPLRAITPQFLPNFGIISLFASVSPLTFRFTLPSMAEGSSLSGST